jgi:hypothetical protein
LQILLHFEEMALSGVFPQSLDETLISGPLSLVKCMESPAHDSCGLVQLFQTYDLNILYGKHYGYRSGLNVSMVRHLQEITTQIFPRVQIQPDDLIIDIGSNDATLLEAYPRNPAIRVGIDPLIHKFRDFYPESIIKIPEFFSSDWIKSKFGNKKAKIVTSIAMFYDLESPMEFIRHIHEILHDEGFWAFEQSYLPFMIEHNAYDTICHEHLEYYAMKQIVWMMEKYSFKIIDVDFNETNGGSFLITVAKKNSQHQPCSQIILNILEKEQIYQTLKPYEQFRHNIEQHREELLTLLQKIKSEDKKVFGYGASTKGNILLQYCHLTSRELECMAEVNEEKFGCFTPLTKIPIIPEKEAREMKPDYFLVLPWHFKDAILKKEEETLKQGTHFIFPLPHIEVY